MSPDDGALEALAATLGERARRHVALGPLTTYRVGGPAALFVEARDEADLVAVAEALRSAGGAVPVLVLGKGSNLLVADAGFSGLAVRLAPTEPSSFLGFGVEPAGEPNALVVRGGGALGLPVLARRAVEEGARGLEWAVGVPGSVGGGVRMNAGGHGADVAASLRRYGWFDLASGRCGEGDLARLSPGYRTTSVGPSEVVLWATFTATRGSVEEGKAVIAEIVRWRRAHQPGGSNAGSVFTNPEGTSAGALIEGAGLKGLRVGTAEVSTKHANFIQADEAGSADDVYRLMGRVRALVAERTGVVLASEVRLVGFPDDEGTPP